MTEFEWDCLQKKGIARSATHRVGMRRSVSLPSDRLDARELQQRNGPCRVYRLGAPMEIRQFEELPSDLQRAYLQRLRSRGATQEGVRCMLGVSRRRMELLRQRSRVMFDMPDEAAWMQFLHGRERKER